MDCLTQQPDTGVRITLGHRALAQQLTERSRHNLHHLLIELNQSNDNRNQRTILELIKQHKGGLTVRDLCRSTGSRANDIRSALDVLLESGDLEEVEHKPPTGRPTKFYRIPL
jgi:Fic family protein